MEQVEQFQIFRSLLLSWNEKVNLIGPEATKNLDEHIAEAVEAAELLQPRDNVLDFGSGGGLPAIPMAIRSPEATFHMVEADQKKWAFLKFAVRECALKSVVHGDRLERLVPRLDRQLRFSLVTSRAVGRPHEWVGQLIGHLEPDAVVALFHGAERCGDVPGFEHVRSVRLSRGTSNYLVILKKSGDESHG
jgi:16S rRNA (guanine(527)-N(7))-methyltransferase RsmG